jgi:sterol desaturase/sphingolipid hydroxylase (fatty acid hydroxylase superfamily)
MPALEHSLLDAAQRVQRASSDTFFSLGSTFSFASLAGALLVAASFIVVMRLRRRGRLRPRAVIKALWPRPQVFGASGRADCGFFLLNTFSTGGLIGWGLLSQAQVSGWTLQFITSLAGPSRAHWTGPWPAVLASTAMFLAYELAYWVDHWLSHNVPCLWEIHKVHHTAEALSPLTNFRVHPLETLKFYNIAVLFTGCAAGALDYALGPAHDRLSLLGVDALFIVFMFTFSHLLHSHVWISLPAPLGRVLMSPAAHQIHHSTDPRHFGRNLGNALALWDWLFGTLRLPSRRREPLTFGVAGQGPAAHTVAGALIAPVVNAARVLVRRESAGDQAAVTSSRA